jgi:hypothetical protein
VFIDVFEANDSFVFLIMQFCIIHCSIVASIKHPVKLLLDKSDNLMFPELILVLIIEQLNTQFINLQLLNSEWSRIDLVKSHRVKLQYLNSPLFKGEF